MVSQSGNGHSHRSINKGSAVSGRNAGSNRMGYDGAKDAGNPEGEAPRGGYPKGINVAPCANRTNMGFGVYSTGVQGGPITGALINRGEFPWENVLRYVMGDEAKGSATELAEKVAPKDASKVSATPAGATAIDPTARYKIGDKEVSGADLIGLVG